MIVFTFGKYGPEPVTGLSLLFLLQERANTNANPIIITGRLCLKGFIKDVCGKNDAKYRRVGNRAGVKGKLFITKDSKASLMYQ